ncbi:death domain-containing protein 1 [Elgaria multicarinata webbii]|uniref:death domain-containing protein 1 n=1 Tax=Elgaria multicarinata webbii TaxID=159646 RepID=UPI002FCD3ACF
MEATETAVDDLDQILERIFHHNLTLGETLLKSHCQDSEKIAAYIPKLTSLLLDLVKALSQQLEHTTNIVQNTYQLLNMLCDKDWPQVSRQEGSSLADWLLELSKHILHAVRHFGGSQNELLELSRRNTNQGQHAPCVPGMCECDADRGEVNGMQVPACVSQPFHEPSPRREEGNRSQLTGNHVEETKMVVTLNEEISGKGQEFPMFVKNGSQSIPEKSITIPSQNNGKDSVKSSADNISENIYLDDIPGGQEENAVGSGVVENSRINHLQMHPNQEKQAEIKEALKPEENGNRRLIAKPGRRHKDFNQQERNEGSAQSNPENSTRSEDLPKNSSIDLSAGKLEEEDNGEGWINKEFLMEANGPSEPEVACSITASCSILGNLVIKVVNDLSSLVVDDSEELVSNVVSVECLQHGSPMVSPITLAIPFTSRYRGMYKDIMVKVMDAEFRSRYLTPVSLEGHYGNHKGTFAEVKTCQLGIFSVVSCLKTETFTIPRKGLSRKLNMDPRISFCYPPSTFNSRVKMHLKVQPIEPSTISILKTKHDTYHSVVSTSPLVHLQHPSSQPFNKSITVILPCPPKQEKKREGDETDCGRTTSASIQRVSTAHHFRAISAPSRKHGENLNESLKLLGYRDEEWALLDDITVRNARNGLVSFELDEPLDSFIIIRLSSAMDNMHLVRFIRNLEQAIHNTMVKVVLYRGKEDPYKIVVLLVPSKELNVELQSLREEGYSGPPDPSQQFFMREGEKVYFKFSGNICASDDGMAFGGTYKLTFHAQRKPRLALHIKEVDEFGNYSSPHYKGTALFYKVSKGDIAKSLEQPLLLEDYQHQAPLCKLALTLPKNEKLISRPQSTKRISTDSSEAMWDNLLYWLSQELSEENASRLALSLPLHRSTLQLIKLKCPDNLTEQIYELLCFWKRNLPRSADKLRLLSRYLGKSGRSDLVEDLRFKWENKMLARKTHG